VVPAQVALQGGWAMGLPADADDKGLSLDNCIIRLAASG
jgi:hypothetical protein